jgi:DNA-binding SARP family transcriptional activator
MSDARPRDLDRHLLRERLLGRLPDQPGHVVWLQAPYGYGKSVLAAQWAAALEGAGWRVLWVAAVPGEDPRAALARRLALPDAAPWDIVLEALAESPTATIVEDLEGAEPITPLLRSPTGLVLLASRLPLPQPELPRLAASGRLLHLDARALAFTLDEAQALFPDRSRAEQAWTKTGGWPLLLHLAALTGEIASDLGPALLTGMRESLSAAAWDEALLLATIERLPHAVASEATLALAASGFAFRVDDGYRIHPLLADLLRAAEEKRLRDVVERAAPRLPPSVRAGAFEAARLLPQLARVLETEDDLARDDPEAVLRWDALAGGTRGWLRLTQVGQALCLRGRIEEGIEVLRKAVADAGADVERRLLAAKELVWNLATVDPAAARTLTSELEVDLARAPDELAGRFLNDAGRIAFLAGDFAGAEAMTERALQRYAPDSPRRVAAQINLGILRFNRAGELDFRIHSAEESLPRALAWTPEHVPGIHLDLGRLYGLLGNETRMLDHLERAARGSRSRPWINLAAEVLLAVAQGRFDAAAAPLARLRAWGNEDVTDGVLGVWAWALIGNERAADALTLLQGANGFLAHTCRALALALLGRGATVADLPAEDQAPEREPALYLAAARWRIGRDARDLDHLLSLTTAGARILPGLVALGDLPRDRPQLAIAYPLDAVLASGWKEAIAVRASEIPPLRLTLLGTLRFERGRELLDLPPRLQEILVLLALGQTRDEVADALWPELGAQAARNNLHVNLNKLRRAVEPWGVATYLLETGLVRVESDLEELRAALRGKVALRVMELYRGDLAPGVSLAVVDEARERLRREVILFLSSSARGAAAGESEPMLARVVELDPLNEPVVQELLRVLVATGRRARAMQVFEQFRERLGEETGTRPLAATRAVLDGAKDN